MVSFFGLSQNWTSLIVLLTLIAVVWIFDRKNFKRDGIAFMRRTQRGLNFIQQFCEKHENLLEEIWQLRHYGFLRRSRRRIMFLPRRKESLGKNRNHICCCTCFASNCAEAVCSSLHGRRRSSRPYYNAAFPGCGADFFFADYNSPGPACASGADNRSSGFFRSYRLLADLDFHNHGRA